MSAPQQMLIGAGRPRVQVAYQAAGAGDVDTLASGSIAPSFPSGVAYGHGLLMHVVAQDATLAFATTPSGWTLVNSQGNGSTFLSALFWKIATGLESGGQPVSVGNSVAAWARMYRFNRVSAIESSGGQFNAGSSTTMPATNVTSTVPLACAIQAMFARVNTTIGNISGESGGDYTEAIAEYAVGGGGAGLLSLQTAPLAAAGSITGGSATLGAAGTNRVTHAVVLKP